MRRRLAFINVIISIVGFVAGLIASIALGQAHAMSVSDRESMIFALFVVVAGILFAFALIVSFYFNEIDFNQGQIAKYMEEVNNKFGLKVEFMEEHNGETYERTKELIKRAERTIRILDYWVQTAEYGGSELRGVRQEYYSEIEAQIELRKQRYYIAQAKRDHETFHKRIIQLSQLEEITDNTPIKAGQVFRNYALRCIEVEGDYHHTHLSSFKVAPLYIPASFIIIDDRYVILTIFSTNARETQVTRLGAIFFDDPTTDKVFVEKMIAIFNTVDNNARRVYQRNFPAPETPASAS